MMIETNETVIGTQIQISEVKQEKKESQFSVKTVESKKSSSKITIEQKTNVPKEEASVLKEQIVIESSKEEDNSVLADSKEQQVQFKTVFEEKNVATVINKGSK